MGIFRHELNGTWALRPHALVIESWVAGIQESKSVMIILPGQLLLRMIKDRPETMIEDCSHQRIFGQTLRGSLDCRHRHNWTHKLDLVNQRHFCLCHGKLVVSNGGALPSNEPGHAADEVADHGCWHTRVWPEDQGEFGLATAWPPCLGVTPWLPWIGSHDFWPAASCLATMGTAQPKSQLMRINYWATNITTVPNLISHIWNILNSVRC